MWLREARSVNVLPVVLVSGILLFPEEIPVKEMCLSPEGS